jgi:hypothetical protein
MKDLIFSINLLFFIYCKSKLRNMRVFISWSGERSKAVAELLSEWIECVIQAVEPWVSSKDIDRGALWFTEINEQLANVSVGIVCLTGDNKDKPWILFESGALAKGLTTNRVCTFLVDLQPSDLENPLAQFNHTLPDREGVFKLIRTINASLGDTKLKDNILESVFDTYWPSFETKFVAIINDIPTGSVPNKRPEESILNEVLNTVRSMDKRLRNVELDQPDIKINRTEGAIRKLFVGVNDGTLLEKQVLIKALKEGIKAGKNSLDVKNEAALNYNISISQVNKVFMEAALDLL